MKPRTTIQELRKLIKGSAVEKLNPHLFEELEKVDKICPKMKVKKVSKTKDWMERHLIAWCETKKYQLEKEHVFSDRKFRFDFAILEIKVAFEYEGIMSEKARHTTVTGYSKDADKYNLAQSLGWKVLRYTVINHKQLLTDLEKL